MELGKKGILGAMLFPIFVDFITGLWDSMTTFVAAPSFGSFWSIMKNFFLLIFNSQQIVYESIMKITAGGLTGWEFIHWGTVILGGSLITVFLVWGIYKFVLWIRGEASWDRVSLTLILLSIIFVVGFVSSYASYATTSIFHLPYHGFLNLHKLFLPAAATPLGVNITANATVFL